jgi:hypothetical protein
MRRPGMVAHTCSTSCRRGRNWEAHSLRPVQGKSWWNPITTNNQGIVVHTCGSNYTGGYR